MKVTSLEHLQVSSLTLNESAQDRLVITIAAIHNCTTRNLTHYTAEALKSSLDVWTKPYEKKVLKNHDIDAEPLGRVISATYALDEKACKEAVYLTAEITDKDAIQKIMDKRYTTVSIGGSSDSVKCSICGTNIAKEGWCDHAKGEFYEGAMCYWIIDNIEPDEVSFVNAPADVYAGVTDIMNPAMLPGVMFGNSAGNSGAVGVVESVKDPKRRIEMEGNEKTLEQVQAELAQANETINTITAENTALKSDKETLVSEKEALVADKATLSESLATMETDRNNISNENTVLKEQAQTAQQEVENVKAEKQQLEAQVIDVRSKLHESLAMRVALAKAFAGEIPFDKVEEAAAELKARTEESLNDSMSDIIKKAKIGTIEKIDNPGQAPAHQTENLTFASKSKFEEYLGDTIRNIVAKTK